MEHVLGYDSNHRLDARAKVTDASGQSARGLAEGSDKARRTTRPTIVHADGPVHVARKHQLIEDLVVPPPKIAPISGPCRLQDLEIYFGTLGLFNGL
jgi:hypothetical protein